MEDIEYLEEYRDIVLPSISASTSNNTANNTKEREKRREPPPPNLTDEDDDSSGSSDIDLDIFEKLFKNSAAVDDVKQQPKSKKNKNKPPVKSNIRPGPDSFSSSDYNSDDSIYNLLDGTTTNRRETIDSIDALVNDLGGYAHESAQKPKLKKSSLPATTTVRPSTSRNSTDAILRKPKLQNTLSSIKGSPTINFRIQKPSAEDSRLSLNRSQTKTKSSDLPKVKKKTTATVVSTDDAKLDKSTKRQFFLTSKDLATKKEPDPREDPLSMDDDIDDDQEDSDVDDVDFITSNDDDSFASFESSENVIDISTDSNFSRANSAIRQTPSPNVSDTGESPHKCNERMQKFLDETCRFVRRDSLNSLDDEERNLETSPLRSATKSSNEKQKSSTLQKLTPNKLSTSPTTSKQVKELCDTAKTVEQRQQQKTENENDFSKNEKILPSVEQQNVQKKIEEKSNKPTAESTPFIISPAKVKIDVAATSSSRADISRIKRRLYDDADDLVDIDGSNAMRQIEQSSLELQKQLTEMIDNNLEMSLDNIVQSPHAQLLHRQISRNNSREGTTNFVPLEKTPQPTVSRLSSNSVGSTENKAPKRTAGGGRQSKTKQLTDDIIKPSDCGATTSSKPTKREIHKSPIKSVNKKSDESKQIKEPKAIKVLHTEGSSVKINTVSDSSSSSPNKTNLKLTENIKKIEESHKCNKTETEKSARMSEIKTAEIEQISQKKNLQQTEVTTSSTNENTKSAIMEQKSNIVHGEKTPEKQFSTTKSSQDAAYTKTSIQKMKTNENTESAIMEQKCNIVHGEKTPEKPSSTGSRTKTPIKKQISTKTPQKAKEHSFDKPTEKSRTSRSSESLASVQGNEKIHKERSSYSSSSSTKHHDRSRETKNQHEKHRSKSPSRSHSSGSSHRSLSKEEHRKLDDKKLIDKESDRKVKEKYKSPTKSKKIIPVEEDGTKSKNKSEHKTSERGKFEKNTSKETKIDSNKSVNKTNEEPEDAKKLLTETVKQKENNEEKLSEHRRKKRKKDKEKSKEREIDKEQKKDKGKEIEKDKGKEIEKDKGKEMEKDKGKEIEKDKGKEMEKDKGKEMEKDKEKEMEKNKGKEMDKYKEKDKGKNLDKEKTKGIEKGKESDKAKESDKDKGKEIEEEKDKRKKIEKDKDKRKPIEKNKDKGKEVDKDKQLRKGNEKEKEKDKEKKKGTFAAKEKYKNNDKDKNKEKDKIFTSETEKARQESITEKSKYAALDLDTSIADKEKQTKDDKSLSKETDLSEENQDQNFVKADQVVSPNTDMASTKDKVEDCSIQPLVFENSDTTNSQDNTVPKMEEQKEEDHNSVLIENVQLKAESNPASTLHEISEPKSTINATESKHKNTNTETTPKTISTRKTFGNVETKSDINSATSDDNVTRRSTRSQILESSKALRSGRKVADGGSITPIKYLESRNRSSEREKNVRITTTTTVRQSPSTKMTRSVNKNVVVNNSSDSDNTMVNSPSGGAKLTRSVAKNLIDNFGDTVLLNKRKRKSAPDVEPSDKEGVKTKTSKATEQKIVTEKNTEQKIVTEKNTKNLAEVGKNEENQTSSEVGKADEKLPSTDVGNTDEKLLSADFGNTDEKLLSAEVEKTDEKLPSTEVGKTDEKLPPTEIEKTVEKLASAEVEKTDEKLPSTEVEKYEESLPSKEVEKNEEDLPSAQNEKNLPSAELEENFPSAELEKNEENLSSIDVEKNEENLPSTELDKNEENLPFVEVEKNEENPSTDVEKNEENLPSTEVENNEANLPSTDVGEKLQSTEVEENLPSTVSETPIENIQENSEDVVSNNFTEPSGTNTADTIDQSYTTITDEIEQIIAATDDNIELEITPNDVKDKEDVTIKEQATNIMTDEMEQQEVVSNPSVVDIDQHITDDDNEVNQGIINAAVVEQSTTVAEIPQDNIKANVVTTGVELELDQQITKIDDVKHSISSAPQEMVQDTIRSFDKANDGHSFESIYEDADMVVEQFIEVEFAQTDYDCENRNKCENIANTSSEIGVKQIVHEIENEIEQIITGKAVSILKSQTPTCDISVLNETTTDVQIPDLQEIVILEEPKEDCMLPLNQAIVDNVVSDVPEEFEKESKEIKSILSDFVPLTQDEEAETIDIIKNVVVNDEAVNVNTDDKVLNEASKEEIPKDTNLNCITVLNSDNIAANNLEVENVVTVAIAENSGELESEKLANICEDIICGKEDDVPTTIDRENLVDENAEMKMTENISKYNSKKETPSAVTHIRKLCVRLKREHQDDGTFAKKKQLISKSSTGDILQTQQQQVKFPIAADATTDINLNEDAIEKVSFTSQDSFKGFKSVDITTNNIVLPLESDKTDNPTKEQHDGKEDSKADSSTNKELQHTVAVEKPTTRSSASSNLNRNTTQQDATENNRKLRVRAPRELSPVKVTNPKEVANVATAAKSKDTGVTATVTAVAASPVLVNEIATSGRILRKRVAENSLTSETNANAKRRSNFAVGSSSKPGEQQSIGHLTRAQSGKLSAEILGTSSFNLNNKTAESNKKLKEATTKLTDSKQMMMRGAQHVKEISTTLLDSRNKRSISPVKSAENLKVDQKQSSSHHIDKTSTATTIVKPKTSDSNKSASLSKQMTTTTVVASSGKGNIALRDKVTLNTRNSSGNLDVPLDSSNERKETRTRNTSKERNEMQLTAKSGGETPQPINIRTRARNERVTPAVSSTTVTSNSVKELPKTLTASNNSSTSVQRTESKMKSTSIVENVVQSKNPAEVIRRTGSRERVSKNATQQLPETKTSTTEANKSLAKQSTLSAEAPTAVNEKTIESIGTEKTNIVKTHVGDNTKEICPEKPALSSEVPQKILDVNASKLSTSSRQLEQPVISNISLRDRVSAASTSSSEIVKSHNTRQLLQTPNDIETEKPELNSQIVDNTKSLTSDNNDDQSLKRKLSAALLSEQTVMPKMSLRDRSAAPTPEPVNKPYNTRQLNTPTTVACNTRRMNRTSQTTTTAIPTMHIATRSSRHLQQTLTLPEQTDTVSKVVTTTMSISQYDKQQNTITTTVAAATRPNVNNNKTTAVGGVSTRTSMTSITPVRASSVESTASSRNEKRKAVVTSTPVTAAKRMCLDEISIITSEIKMPLQQVQRPIQQPTEANIIKQSLAAELVCQSVLLKPFKIRINRREFKKALKMQFGEHTTAPKELILPNAPTIMSLSPAATLQHSFVGASIPILQAEDQIEAYQHLPKESTSLNADLHHQISTEFIDNSKNEPVLQSGEASFVQIEPKLEVTSSIAQCINSEQILIVTTTPSSFLNTSSSYVSSTPTTQLTSVNSALPSTTTTTQLESNVQVVGRTCVKTYLHPPNYHRRYENVKLDSCCEQRDTMSAIDPTRSHERVMVHVRDMPAFISMTTRVLTTSEYKKNRGSIPESIRIKLDRQIGVGGGVGGVETNRAQAQMSHAKMVATSKSYAPTTTTTTLQNDIQNVSLKHMLQAPAKPMTANPCLRGLSQDGVDLLTQSNVSPIDRLKKQLPSGITITEKVRYTDVPPETTTMHSVTPHSTTASTVLLGSQQSNTTSQPPFNLGTAPQSEERLKLLRSVQLFDEVLQNTSRRVLALSSQDRQNIIEAIVKNSKLEAINFDKGIKLLENYEKWANAVLMISASSAAKRAMATATATSSTTNLVLPTQQSTQTLMVPQVQQAVTTTRTLESAVTNNLTISKQQQPPAAKPLSTQLREQKKHALPVGQSTPISIAEKLLEKAKEGRTRALYDAQRNIIGYQTYAAPTAKVSKVSTTATTTTTPTVASTSHEHATRNVARAQTIATPMATMGTISSAAAASMSAIPSATERIVFTTKTGLTNTTTSNYATAPFVQRTSSTTNLASNSVVGGGIKLANIAKLQTPDAAKTTSSSSSSKIPFKLNAAGQKTAYRTTESIVTTRPLATNLNEISTSAAATQKQAQPIFIGSSMRATLNVGSTRISSIALTPCASADESILPDAMNIDDDTTLAATVVKTELDEDIIT